MKSKICISCFPTAIVNANNAKHFPLQSSTIWPAIDAWANSLHAGEEEEKLLVFTGEGFVGGGSISHNNDLQILWNIKINYKSKRKDDINIYEIEQLIHYKMKTIIIVGLYTFLCAKGFYWRGKHYKSKQGLAFNS